MFACLKAKTWRQKSTCNLCFPHLSQVTLFWLHGFQFCTLSVFWFLGRLIPKYRCFPLPFIFYQFYECRHFSNYSVCHFHHFHSEIKYKIFTSPLYCPYSHIYWTSQIQLVPTFWWECSDNVLIIIVQLLEELAFNENFFNPCFLPS